MRSIHQGEILREEYLLPLDMRVNALARALRVDATRMNEIVRERRRITPDTAERLARYFSTAAQFWMNLQVQYDLKEFEVSEEAAEIARDVQPRKQVTA